MPIVVKHLPANAEDVRDSGSVPGLGRSPGGRQNNTVQYCCLENPVNRATGRIESIGLQRVQHVT